MSNDNSPFSPPESELRTPSEDSASHHILLDEPIKSPVSDGHRWIGDGFQLFKSNALMLIVTLLVYYALAVIISFIPFVSVLSSILSIVCIAGLYYGFYKAEQGEPYSVNHLFAGFKVNTQKLFLLGVFYLVSIIVLTVVAMIIAAIAFGPELFTLLMELEQTGEPTFTDEDATMFMLKISLVVLVCMAFYIPVVMGIWFAPILVIIHGLDPFDAMKRSFRACLRNFWPLTWWSILVTLLLFATVFTLFLGLIVVMPVMMGSIYASYKYIFLANSSNEQVVAA